MNRAPRPRGKTRFVNSRPERINYNNLLKEMQEEQQNGSFTLVEKTIRKQQEEAENLDNFESAEIISEEERLKRRRASLMSNLSNKYAYSIKDEIIHDRDCELASKIPDDEFTMMTDWYEPYKICDKCYRYCLLRAGIIDDYKNIESYYNFFKGGADNKLLHYLIIENKAKFRFVDNLKNSIQIKVNNEDTWLLHRDKNKKYTLYHNNYIQCDNGERHFIDGYHRQQCKDNGTSARFAISTMCTYSYSEHKEKEHKKSDKVLYGRDCPKWIKRLMKELRRKQKKSVK